MRLGVARGPLDGLDGAAGEVEAAYAALMAGRVSLREVPVMLGDSTVMRQKTFDPDAVGRAFSQIVGRLPGWESEGVATASNDDIRRIFVKFHIMEGNYRISAHLSVQFHVLLYYQPKQRVVDCQKELSGVVDQIGSVQDGYASAAEQFIADKLTSMYGKMDHQELFERLYRDEGLRQDLERQVEEGRGEQLRRLEERKSQLFAELDSLLVETYQTTTTVIDEARLVTGEEGCLCSLDVEYVRRGIRGSIPRRVAPGVIERIRGRLGEVRAAILACGDGEAGSGA